MRRVTIALYTLACAAASCLVACGTSTPTAPAIPAPPPAYAAEAARCDAGHAEACDAIAAHFGGGSEAITCTRRSSVAVRSCRRTDPARPLLADPARRAEADRWSARAAALYEADCDAGDAAACVARGRLVAAVEGGRYAAEPRAFFDRALALWGAACAAGQAADCRALVAAYDAGLIVDRDRRASTRARLAACGAGDRSTCRRLIRALDRPRPLFVPPAPKPGALVAAPLAAVLGASPPGPWAPRVDPAPYRAACAKGDGGACFEAGALLAETDEQKSARAFGRARAIFERRCARAEGDACLGLGLLYARGAAVEHDADRASGLIDQACALGSAHGCVRRGKRLAFDPDPAARSAGLTALHTACVSDARLGCGVLGVLVASGAAAEPDLPAACAHLERACETDRRSCRLARHVCDPPAGR